MRNLSMYTIVLPMVFTLGFADSSGAALADAVQRQDSRAVLALLEQHADVNATLADGSTACSGPRAGMMPLWWFGS